METKTTMNTYVNPAMAAGDRILNPIKTPKQIVLFGTIADNKTTLYIDDACGLASAARLVGGATSTEFSVQGKFTTENINKFLLSHAIIVSRYNLNASNQENLANNLEMIQSKLDGTFENDYIFSSLNVSNMQFNADLLNIVQGFVWTCLTALSIDGAEGNLYTITMGIKKVVPYGQLDAYLDANVMYKTV